MRTFRIVTIAASACAALAAALVIASRPSQPQCRCADAKLNSQWCEVCKVGFVGGVRIPSAMLFETLDAHGHDVNRDAIGCPNCRAMIKVDGFCDACGIGFNGGQAYVSRLTYHLARGEPLDVAGLSCPTCRVNAEKFGWCDKCDVGMVGNVRYQSRREYEPARQAFERLLVAVRMLDRCEICAAALWGSGMCPKCGIQYKDGRPTPPATP